jgi:hypothetical protein
MKTKMLVETKEQMERVVEQLKSSPLQNALPERRRNRWWMTYHTPGTVEMGDGSGNLQPIYMAIHDISMEGLGFLSHKPLISGQKLVINLETDNGEIEVCDTVVHCTETLGKFKIGVKFDFCDPIDNCEMDL